MHRVVLLAVSIGLTLSVTVVLAEDTQAENALFANNRIARLRNCIRDNLGLRAKMVQEIYQTSDSAPVRLTGTVEIRSADQLRVEYDAPHQQIIVANRRGILSYDPEKKTGFRTTGNSNVFFRLLDYLTNPKTKETFTPRQLPTPSPIKNNAVAIALSPSQPDEFIRHFVIGLVGHCPALRRLVIVDKTGTLTRITFDHFETELKLNARRFYLSIPKGTTITYP